MWAEATTVVAPAAAVVLPSEIALVYVTDAGSLNDRDGSDCHVMAFDHALLLGTGQGVSCHVMNCSKVVSWANNLETVLVARPRCSRTASTLGALRWEPAVLETCNTSCM